MFQKFLSNVFIFKILENCKKKIFVFFSAKPWKASNLIPQNLFRSYLNISKAIASNYLLCFWKKALTFPNLEIIIAFSQWCSVAKDPETTCIEYKQGIRPLYNGYCVNWKYIWIYLPHSNRRPYFKAYYILSKCTFTYFNLYAYLRRKLYKSYFGSRKC